MGYCGNKICLEEWRNERTGQSTLCLCGYCRHRRHKNNEQSS